MRSQTEKQVISIRILPNISRIKGNQKMKFGYLIEQNIRNIFVEKSDTKCGGETSHRPFSKIQNWSHLYINSLNFIKFVFILCPSQELLNYIETKVPIACFYLTENFYLKIRKRSGASLSFLFSVWFLKENTSHVIFYYLVKFHFLIAFTSWDVRLYVYCNYLFPSLWHHKSWN